MAFEVPMAFEVQTATPVRAVLMVMLVRRDPKAPLVPMGSALRLDRHPGAISGRLLLKPVLRPVTVRVVKQA
jgi:hypothetical protein